MKLLYVVDFLYFDKGGANISANAHLNTLIKIYGKKNVDVVSIPGRTRVASKYDEIDIIYGPGNGLALFLNSLLGRTTYLDSKGENKLIRIIENNKYDVIFIDNSIYGKFVKRIKQLCPKILVITYYHDVKAYLAKVWYDNAAFYKKIVYYTMIKSEYINQKYSDVNLTINDREAELFRKYYDKQSETRFSVYMNVDLRHEYINNKKEMSDVLSVVFIGSYYKPNVKGIKWFIEKVIPELNFKFNLIIAGSNMDNLQHEIINSSENIKIYGYVEDLSLIYEEADVVISPIFEGGGMKVKTTNSLAFGKVLIATDESYIGYTENIPNEYWGKFFFRANTKKEFVSALNTINDRKGFKYNQEVRNIYSNHYSEEYASKILKVIIDEGLKTMQSSN